MTSKQTSFIYRNGLSLVLLALFAVSLAGQVWTGLRAFNEERADQGAAPVTLARYLHSGHFLSATFENWEIEFLQNMENAVRQFVVVGLPGAVPVDVCRPFPWKRAAGELVARWAGVPSGRPASHRAGGVHDASVTRRIDWKIQWCARAPPG